GQRPQTQNNKRKSNHEKSKHSVQTNSSGSGPAALRLLRGIGGSHAGVSPRRAVQWNCIGTQFVAVLCKLLRSYYSRLQFRRRERVGNLHRNRAILSAPLRAKPESL